MLDEHFPPVSVCLKVGRGGLRSPGCRCPRAGKLCVGCCDRESHGDTSQSRELFLCDSLRGLRARLSPLRVKTQRGIDGSFNLNATSDTQTVPTVELKRQAETCVVSHGTHNLELLAFGRYIMLR